MSMEPRASSKKLFTNVGGGYDSKFKCKVAVLCVLLGQTFSDVRHIIPQTLASQKTGTHDECGNVQLQAEYSNAEHQDELPWVVTINYRSRGGKHAGVDLPHCFGSLISDRHVLTAASCIDLDCWLLDIMRKLQFCRLQCSRLQDYHHATYIVQFCLLYWAAPSASVRVGRHNMHHAGVECVRNLHNHECTASTLTVSVAATRIHDMYDPITLANNLAVIRLAESVIYTDYVQPICWKISQYNKIKDNKKYDITYWSSGYSTKDQNNVIVKKVEISKEECETRVANYFKIEQYNLTEYIICTRDAKTNLNCLQDAGSPLVYKNSNSNCWYQRGISSFNTNCTENNFLSIYTNLEDYQDWITESISTLYQF